MVEGSRGTCQSTYFASSTHFSSANANADHTDANNANGKDNSNGANSTNDNGNSANANPKCLGDPGTLWDNLSQCWNSLDRASQLGTLLGELGRTRELGYLPRSVQTCPASTG